MSQKAMSITGWALTALIGLVMIGSAGMKLMGDEEAAQGAEAMGLTASNVKIIALVELVSILLFIIPRTGVLGTLMLAAYLGGAIVIHVVNHQPFIVPVLIEALVWIAAIIRFPELTKRITSNRTVNKEHVITT